MNDTHPLELWSTCYDEERGQEVVVVALLDVPGDEHYAQVQAIGPYVMLCSSLTHRRPQPRLGAGPLPPVQAQRPIDIKLDKLIGLLERLVSMQEVSRVR